MANGGNFLQDFYRTFFNLVTPPHIRQRAEELEALREQQKAEREDQKFQEQVAQRQFMQAIQEGIQPGPTGQQFAQNVATATVPTKATARQAIPAAQEIEQRRAEADAEKALNKTIAILPPETGKRLRAAYETDRALQPMGLTADMRNRLFAEQVGPDVWAAFQIQQAKSAAQADRFATQRFWPDVAAAGIVIPNAASIFVSLAKADSPDGIKNLYARLLLSAIATRDELTDPSAQEFGLLNPESLMQFDSNFLQVATALGNGEEAQQFLGGKINVQTQSIILRAHERGLSRQDILRQWEEFAKQALGDNAIAMRNQRRQVIEWLNVLERRQQRSLRR